MEQKSKCAWCKIDTEKQLSVKSDELPIDEKYSRSYSVHRCPTCGGLRDSGQEYIRINNMCQIYQGAVMLMQRIIDILEEQMSYAEVTGDDLCDIPEIREKLKEWTGYGI